MIAPLLPDGEFQVLTWVWHICLSVPMLLTGLARMRDLASGFEMDAPEVKANSMLTEFVKGMSLSLCERYHRDFESREDFERHRVDVVDRLRRWLGLKPWPERNPLDPREVGRLETDGIIIEKVLIEARPGDLVNAMVFVPQEAEFPVPAIMNPYGHWPDKYQEEVQIRCIQLAKRGYIALTYDPIGQGERVWLGNHEDVRRQAMLCGHSLSGMMFWDTMRCIDYLYSRPDVDRNGVGCVGLSGGGFNTLYTSVLDERIVASVPTVYATSLERVIRRGSAGCCAYLPHHATWGEVDDMYALIAPRPLLILAGGEKDLWLSGGALQNHEVAGKSYRLYGSDRLQVFVDESVGHTLSQPMRERMYFWFNKWLRGDDDPEHARETSVPGLFEREKRELDVFDDFRGRGRSLVEVNRDLVRAFEEGRARPERSQNLPAYQASLREELLGRLGDTADTEAAAEVEQIEMGGPFHADEIRLTTEPGITLPVRLIRPASDAPSKVVVYLRTDEVESSLPQVAQSVCQFLASGCAVFFLRVRGTWETNYKQGSEDCFGARDTELYSLALGKNLFGMRVHDVIQTVAYIGRRDEVKGVPVACVAEGLRECLVAIYAAALDEGIASLITNGGLISYRYFLDNALYPPHEFFVPQILRYADTLELLACVAPKRTCVINA